jgi:hypothetical protein
MTRKAFLPVEGDARTYPNRYAIFHQRGVDQVGRQVETERVQMAGGLVAEGVDIGTRSAAIVMTQ